MISAFAVMGALILAGCTATAPQQAKKQTAETKKPVVADSDKEEAEIRAALDELDPKDRKLAEAQRWCAINTSSRLGSMDKPVKIELDGQPVFLCCGGCEKAARKNPEKTLAKVAELKTKAAAETKTP